MKSSRTQICLPIWLKAEVKKQAEKKGVSFSEYVKDVLKLDLESKKND